MRRSRPVAVVVAVVVGVAALGVGVGGRWALRDRGRSVEATVTAWFEARADGDCGRLFDLVGGPGPGSGAGSRPGAGSAAGEPWERDEFVERCAEVVGEFGPALGDVEVVATHGDEAVVALSVVLAEPSGPFTRPEGGSISVTADEGVRGSVSRLYQRARLVREAGEWRVVPDRGLLRLGASVEETVRRYLAAFDAGDCEAQIGLLSEPAWSDGGRLTRPQFLERCARAVVDRDDLPFPDRPEGTGWIGDPKGFEVIVDPDGSADRGGSGGSGGSGGAGVVTARLERTPLLQPLVDPLLPDTVTLVRDGWRWRLDDRPAIVDLLELDLALPPEPVPGIPLQRIVHLLPDPAAPVPLDDSVEGSDAAERRADAGFRAGVLATFTRDAGEAYTTGHLALHRFATAEGAAAYARGLGARLPTRPGADPVAPLPAGAVGGAVGTRCGGVNCEAALVAARGEWVVVVDVFSTEAPTDTAALTRATQALGSQLARL